MTNETRAAVLDALYDQFGQSPAVVKGSLTVDQIKEIGDLDEFLNRLADEGEIARDGKGKYFKVRESA